MAEQRYEVPSDGTPRVCLPPFLPRSIMVQNRSTGRVLITDELGSVARVDPENTVQGPVRLSRRFDIKFESVPVQGFADVWLTEAMLESKTTGLPQSLSITGGSVTISQSEINTVGQTATSFLSVTNSSTPVATLTRNSNGVAVLPLNVTVSGYLSVFVLIGANSFYLFNNIFLTSITPAIARTPLTFPVFLPTNATIFLQFTGAGQFQITY